MGLKKSKAINKIIARARKDRAFLVLLVTDPARAIASYNLSAEEIAAFQSNNTEKLLQLLQINPRQGGGEVGHDAGCAGTATCGHTCASTCDVTFSVDVGNTEMVTEGFTDEGGDEG